MTPFTFLQFSMIAMLILGVGLGWSGNELWKDYSNKRIINGLYLSKQNNWQEAMDSAQSLDEYGDFVCINTKGMDYKKIVDTCVHEASHEIFAEYCEKGNEEICFKWLEVIKSNHTL